jgi:tripartite-type tricarboxylate transporter receptor subunit TctC
VPKGTPAEIVARLNREINAGLNEPAVRARLRDVATTPIIYTPVEFGAYVAAEVEKWGRVIRTSGVRPE